MSTNRVNEDNRGLSRLERSAMRSTIAALLLLACTPNAPSRTKTAHAESAHEVNTVPIAAGTTSASAGDDSAAKAPPNAPSAAMSNAPTSTAAPGSTAASLSTQPSSSGSSAAQTAPVATPMGPPMPEHLIYHALPQTQLGFYAVLTPPGYDAPENAARRYPLVVILHGSGSNEVIHGSLADDLGRQDVIYLVPRAPHASPEQFAAGKQGYSAWPSYPAAWGEYGSSNFPLADVDRLQVHKFYTRWIAESLLDARQRYRVTQDRSVVVGHSQGATFAHLFAADYPALVKAYAAYAGPFPYAIKAANGPRQLASLRNAAVVPLLIHHEGDTIVDVANTKKLDALMTEHGVKHATHILPGGTHATDPAVRRLLRAFTREHCCGKERTTADIPVSPQGTLTVPAVNDILTFGPAACDEHISGLTHCTPPAANEPKRCEVYEAEPCARRSIGYRSSSFECVGGAWTRVAKLPAECGIEGRDPELAGCNVQLLRTRPSALSRTDACELVLRCGGVQSVVTCDGNNDGTEASSCQCVRKGTPVPLPQSVYAGEAPQSCLAAAQHCVEQVGATEPHSE